jgi:hypothetical protein
MMPKPSFRPHNPAAKIPPPQPKKTGLIAPPRLVGIFTPLRRDPFAQWRLCQRDPVETTQSAVFYTIR